MLAYFDVPIGWKELARRTIKENAEIEHASPWGKAPGEKVPGEKRKIGAAAARAHREQSARFEAARPAARQARGAPSFPRGGWAGTTGVFCKLF